MNGVKNHLFIRKNNVFKRLSYLIYELSNNSVQIALKGLCMLFD
jgi:hypothetical protein